MIEERQWRNGGRKERGWKCWMESKDGRDALVEDSKQSTHIRFIGVEMMCIVLLDTD